MMTAFGASAAHAVPTVLLDMLPENGPNAISQILDDQGQAGISYYADTQTISFQEVWTSSGEGRLIFNGLEANTHYNIRIKITNNDPNPATSTWSSFSNQLLDPADTGITIDVCPIQPALCQLLGVDEYFITEDGVDDPISDPPVYTNPNDPNGGPLPFSNSNDSDGLSFAQDAEIPRTSEVFTKVLVDEHGGRDYLDFFGGELVSGAMDVMTFGLTDVNGLGDDDCVDPHTGEQNDNFCVNFPFMLLQTPNSEIPEDQAYSDLLPPSGLPEPATLALLGGGLAGLGLVRRRRRV